MKVLFISSGNGINGISPIIKNQGESLKKAGVQIEYFLIIGKGPFSYIKHIFTLRKYIKSKDYDLFHAHYLISSITATFSGCRPLIVSLMGSDTKSGLFWKIIIKLFAFLYWKRVIVKSNSMKRDISIKKAKIIPNGVELDLVRPSNINDKSLQKTILFGSNPNRYVKNYSLAEKAMARLKTNNVYLKVVHSVTHKQIIEEINMSAVLLLTSHWEGSPNIIKEAMACNCPIVSTDVGDVRWLFGEEPGHFLTSPNPDEVAEKILLALDFAENHGRTNGRERLKKLGLDAETIALKITNVYQETLDI